ncbi:MAG TPA: efflux RND transporter periplasmic adaptor subunit [Vicinamibacteria bacterium]|nr:efflux RND transporter periplasmic adaptor subunit [Vicinamibacteria bacterium]
MTKRKALGFGLVALVAVAGTVLQARGVVAPRAAGGTAHPVAEKPAAAGVAAEGRVVAYPGAEVRVGAERGGRLVRVLVEEGAAVRRGQLLAEIESDELRAALAEARARVAEAEAEGRLADANLARRRQLTEEKILSVNELDQATRDVETAGARVETAKASVSRYEALLAKSRITAPIAGTVVARKVDAGQMVETGDHAFTVADLGRLRIEGEAHEADAGAVTLGAEVTITADGYPGHSWRGRVEEIPDSVTLRRIKPQDPSRPTDARVLAVKVAFAERAPLKLGTTVDLRIAASAR